MARNAPSICQTKNCFKIIPQGTVKCHEHMPKDQKDAEREAEIKRIQEVSQMRRWHESQKAASKLSDEVLAEGKAFHEKYDGRLR